MGTLIFKVLLLETFYKEYSWFEILVDLTNYQWLTNIEMNDVSQTAVSNCPVQNSLQVFNYNILVSLLGLLNKGIKKIPLKSIC